MWKFRTHRSVYTSLHCLPIVLSGFSSKLQGYCRLKLAITLCAVMCNVDWFTTVNKHRDGGTIVLLFVTPKPLLDTQN